MAAMSKVLCQSIFSYCLLNECGVGYGHNRAQDRIRPYAMDGIWTAAARLTGYREQSHSVVLLAERSRNMWARNDNGGASMG